jgi:hypothetical protein
MRALAKEPDLLDVEGDDRKEAYRPEHRRSRRPAAIRHHRADRDAPADVPRRDLTDDELGREDLAAQERGRDGAVGEDRPSDQGPSTTAVGAQAAEAVPDSRTAGTASTTGPLLATEDAEGFRARWTDIQTGFVDAPRQAVEQADALVTELM